MQNIGSIMHKKIAIIKADKTPGPLEEDINTMHRYRDSLVIMNDGPYERTPLVHMCCFHGQMKLCIRNTIFIKSIGKVNIGGLPFLPNATDLVEQFVERLIDKSPEEIQEEGILPRGTKEEWESSLDEKVLVGLVASEADYLDFRQNGYYQILEKQLKKGWQEAKYVALYTKAGIGLENGIAVYGQIEDIQSYRTR